MQIKILEITFLSSYFMLYILFWDGQSVMPTRNNIGLGRVSENIHGAAKSRTRLSDWTELNQKTTFTVVLGPREIVTTCHKGPYTVGMGVPRNRAWQSRSRIHANTLIEGHSSIHEKRHKKMWLVVWMLLGAGQSRTGRRTCDMEGLALSYRCIRYLGRVCIPCFQACICSREKIMKFQKFIVHCNTPKN